MRLSPLVVFHVCAGILGLLSGAVAVSFRKGSRGHRMYGNVFFLSMLGMSGAGAFMAFTKFRFMNAQEQIVNVFAGTLTFYLVATAWSAARRKDGETDIFDWGALLAALAVGVGMLTYGLEAAHSQTGLKFGYPAALYFVWASVALLSAAGDACCSLAAVFSSLWTSIDASTNFPFGIDSKYTSVPIPFTTVRSCLPA